MSVRVRIDTKGLEKKLAKLEKDARSAFKNSINRTVTYGRRAIADELVTKTGLKRKRIFDAINIARASDQNLRGNITPIFPGQNGEKRVTRIQLSEFKFREFRQGRYDKLAGMGPRYVKVLRTGFRRKFGYDSSPQIYMRNDKYDNHIRRARAAQVPTMFEIYGIIERWASPLRDRVASEAREEILRKAKGQP